MDDKPAIEYHPFGTITLNFDDGPVKLRRCRLGDLTFAKDYLEEIRVESAPKYDAVIAEVNALREANVGQPEDGDGREAFRQLGVLIEKLTELRQDDSYWWLIAMIGRMGDGAPPPREEWPVEIFRAHTISLNDPMSGRIVAVVDILNHWQSRPLTSGKTPGHNGATSEANSSTPPHLEAPSHPAQPQQ